MLTRWFDWFVRDIRTGRIVIGQWPNPALWLFGIFRLAAWLGPDARTRDSAWIASEVCLLVWAVDELVRGVNPWRRCLGAGVLIWMVLQRAA